MNEISQLLQQRFGLTPEQAQEAENAVLGLIRSRIPPQFQGIFDQFAGQPGGQAGAPAQAGFGGLLGEAESLLGIKA